MPYLSPASSLLSTDAAFSCRRILSNHSVPASLLPCCAIYSCMVKPLSPTVKSGSGSKADSEQSLTKNRSRRFIGLFASPLSQSSEFTEGLARSRIDSFLHKKQPCLLPLPMESFCALPGSVPQEETIIEHGYHISQERLIFNQVTFDWFVQSLDKKKRAIPNGIALH